MKNYAVYFRRLRLNLFAFPFIVTSYAQPSVELQQPILDLSNDGVLMNISAHPDDEDGATLAYYRMKHGVKTYSILFTRGEGGQNEIGPELYEELGVMRTHETLEAGKILGAEVHFLNFMDFGYSKTATETFKKWGGQQEVLRRLVYAIRKYKPDVLFTNHSTVEGHGHHQAVAISAIAAFDAAADSTMFPEQLKLKGISVWQPRKLYFRNFGNTNLVADVANAIGDTNASQRKTYFDIAVNALAMHKTQGLDRADLRRFTRGLSLYRLMRSNSIYERDTTTFFGGVDLWDEPSLVPFQKTKGELGRLHQNMNRDSLLAIASNVLATITISKLQPLTSRVLRMLDHWQEEIEHLVQLSCGVSASFEPSEKILIPNQKTSVTLHLQSSSCKMSDVRYSFDLPTGWQAKEIATRANEKSGTRVMTEFEFHVSDRPTFSLPKATALYNSLEDEGGPLLHIKYKINNRRDVTATIRVPFEVAPRFALHVESKAGLIIPGQVGSAFWYDIKKFSPSANEPSVHVDVPQGWSFQHSDLSENEKTGVFILPPRDVEPGLYQCVIRAGDASQNLTVNVIDLNADRTLSLGIIQSYDNTLAAAARDARLKFSLIDSTTLSGKGDLSRFHTIVVDIRAYLARGDLRKHNSKLLDYVKNGGNLVVMYQKDQDWKPEYAPYPFIVTRKRVSVEEAPVTVLQPNHPLMNVPNKITDADWEGWKQERGVYFPDNVASQYTRLISSHDPDEPALTSGYIVAHYGKGSYIYTSYVWYRQLKEANAGAWRNFVNMICYPKYRKITSQQ